MTANNDDAPLAEEPPANPVPVMDIGSTVWFGAVSVVLTMHKPDGSINIMNQISQITAPCKEAAIGAAITRAMKDLPGHQVHVVTSTKISLPNK